MATYKAPAGMVYDWAEPHTGKIIDVDGSIIPTIEHLYASVLDLSENISIKEYKLVPIEGKMKEVEVLYNDKKAKEEDL